MKTNPKKTMANANKHSPTRQTNTTKNQAAKSIKEFA
jgi:hypothetical protein